MNLYPRPHDAGESYPGAFVDRAMQRMPDPVQRTMFWHSRPDRLYDGRAVQYEQLANDVSTYAAADPEFNDGSPYAERRQAVLSGLGFAKVMMQCMPVYGTTEFAPPVAAADCEIVYDAVKAQVEEYVSRSSVVPEIVSQALPFLDIHDKQTGLVAFGIEAGLCMSDNTLRRREEQWKDQVAQAETGRLLNGIEREHRTETRNTFLELTTDMPDGSSEE